MKCSMTYGSMHYGNNENAPNYVITLRRSELGTVTVVFDFDEPAAGKGVGEAQGAVHEVTLKLPSRTARALSHALQLALTDTASVAIRIEESAAEEPRKDLLV